MSDLEHFLKYVFTYSTYATFPWKNKKDSGNSVIIWAQEKLRFEHDLVTFGSWVIPAIYPSKSLASTNYKLLIKPNSVGTKETPIIKL